MLPDILPRNRARSASRQAQESECVTRLAGLRAPEHCRIGCSDSRVPANVAAGFDPGAVFVRRNVANIIHSSGMNPLSALEFAVKALKVRAYAVDLSQEPDIEGQRGRLAEFNVAEGVRRVCETPIRHRARCPECGTDAVDVNRAEAGRGQWCDGQRRRCPRGAGRGSGTTVRHGSGSAGLPAETAEPRAQRHLAR